MAKIVRDDPGRDERASAVALRVGVVGKEKDVQQVLNWLNGNRLIEQMAYLSSKFKQSDYGEEELRQINKLLGEKMVPVSELGKYRDRDEASNLMMPMIPAVEIPYQMEDLFSWFKTSTKGEIHPLLKIGIFAYEFIRVGPFLENNLIVDLSFFLLATASSGYNFKSIWSAEEEILKNKDGFQQAIFSVEKSGGDLTIWLEYFTKYLSEAAEKAKTKVLNLLGQTPIFKSEVGRVISLTERQIVIMEEMTIRGEMTIKEIRMMLPMVSDDTILRDLKGLIEKKLLRKKGKTKGAVYLMGKVKNFR